MKKITKRIKWNTIHKQKRENISEREVSHYKHFKSFKHNQIDGKRQTRKCLQIMNKKSNKGNKNVKQTIYIDERKVGKWSWVETLIKLA